MQKGGALAETSARERGFKWGNGIRDTMVFDYR